MNSPQGTTCFAKGRHNYTLFIFNSTHFSLHSYKPDKTQKDKPMDERTHEQTDEGKNERTDERTNKQTN